MNGADFWQQQEQELHQQWIEEYELKGSASTRDAGTQCGERSREGENDEQKQPDRNEQQPLHAVV